MQFSFRLFATDASFSAKLAWYSDSVHGLQSKLHVGAAGLEHLFKGNAQIRFWMRQPSTTPEADLQFAILADLLEGWPVHAREDRSIRRRSCRAIPLDYAASKASIKAKACDIRFEHPQV